MMVPVAASMWTSPDGVGDDRRVGDEDVIAHQLDPFTGPRGQFQPLVTSGIPPRGRCLRHGPAALEFLQGQAACLRSVSTGFGEKGEAVVGLPVPARVVVGAVKEPR